MRGSRLDPSVGCHGRCGSVEEMLALRRLLACSTISTISSEGQKLSRFVHPSENNWATTATIPLIPHLMVPENEASASAVHQISAVGGGGGTT